MAIARGTKELTLSPRGRGRGPARSAGRVRGRGKDFQNLQANALGIFQHLSVPEAQNAEALFLEMSRPAYVVVEIDAVLAAIDFDNEAMGKADEIGDVMINRLLAAEFVTRELPRS